MSGEFEVGEFDLGMVDGWVNERQLKKEYFHSVQNFAIKKFGLFGYTLFG